MNTPACVPLRVKRKHVRRLRRPCSRNKVNGQDSFDPQWKIQPCHCDLNSAKITFPPNIIQRQEMTSYFRLFDDTLIQDFLRMDSCYKMSDKYFLAMTFVYFKRARLTLAEYTRKNFFVALYLANTMEEDDLNTKYEIFPWALGKNWRKEFPRFLKQKDKLWARMEYRAAVSRHCCEEVMAIMSSHFLWQRQRADHHGGTQWQCSSHDHIRFPRWPSASPVFCSLCNHGNRSRRAPVSSSSSSGSSAQTSENDLPHTFTPSLRLEITPPRQPVASDMETKHQAQHLCCISPEEVPKADSSWKLSDGIFMDWMNE